jgi:hypothetical protein
MLIGSPPINVASPRTVPATSAQDSDENPEGPPALDAVTDAESGSDETDIK